MSEKKSSTMLDQKDKAVEINLQGKTSAGIKNQVVRKYRGILGSAGR
jgi:hypothetical protein